MIIKYEIGGAENNNKLFLKIKLKAWKNKMKKKIKCQLK